MKETPNAMHANITSHNVLSPKYTGPRAHCVFKPTPIHRLNGRAGVRFISSALDRLVRLWVINTGGLGLIAGVCVLEGLVGGWGELLVVALASGLRFAAADGEHPEETGTDREGTCEPGDAEEARHDLGVHSVDFGGCLHGCNHHSAGCGSHGGRANDGSGG